MANINDIVKYEGGNTTFMAKKLTLSPQNTGTTKLYFKGNKSFKDK